MEELLPTSTRAEIVLQVQYIHGIQDNHQQPHMINYEKCPILYIGEFNQHRLISMNLL